MNEWKNEWICLFLWEEYAIRRLLKKTLQGFENSLFSVHTKTAYVWQGELTHLHRSQKGNINPIRKIIYHQNLIIVGVGKESFLGQFTE